MTEVEAPGLLGKNIAALVQEALRNRIERRAAQASRYGHDFAGLWAQVGDHASGGKLLRPRLFIDTAESLSAETPAQPKLLIDLGAAIEMLHFSFLLHDDVIDRDFRRRQGVNLLGAVRDAHPEPQSGAALRWGSAAGILAGDLLLAEVHQIFARVQAAESVRHRLLDLLDYTIQESVCGEQADVGLGLGAIEPTLAAALPMTQYKTATYSFELPLRAAAIVAGADQAAETALTVAARHVGTAYQLQDDLLSAFGNAEEHGKDQWSDFREAKQTPLMTYARTTDAWPQIAEHLGRTTLTQADLVQLRGLLTSCGAEDFVEGLLAEHLTALNDLLSEPSPIPAAARSVLIRHTETMKGRTR